MPRMPNTSSPFIAAIEGVLALSEFNLTLEKARKGEPVLNYDFAVLRGQRCTSFSRSSSADSIWSCMTWCEKGISITTVTVSWESHETTPKVSGSRF